MNRRLQRGKWKERRIRLSFARRAIVISGDRSDTRRMFRRASLLVIACALATASAAELPPAKVLDRYRQMLAANPAEGTALDRLWSAHAEAGATGALIAEYEADRTFSGQMILGHLLVRAGKLEEALAAYGRAATADPKSALPSLSSGKVFAQLGRHRPSAEAYEAAAALAAQDASSDALLSAGTEWAAAGEPERAAAAWEKAAALSPEDTALRQRLAETYLANGLAEKAVPHLEAAADRAPISERPAALRKLAQIQRHAGHSEEAIATLERAVALTSPSNWLRASLQSDLIRIYEREQRLPALEEKWRQAVAAHPRDAGALLQLADLYAHTGDFTQEEERVKQLTALLPGNVAYQLRLLKLYEESGDLAGATAICDALLATQPGNVSLIFQRADLELRAGQPDAARNRVEALLKARGTEEGVHASALDFFERNRFWGPIEKQLAAEATGGNSDAVLAFARYFFRHRRFAEAQAHLQRLPVEAATEGAKAAAWLQVAQILKEYGFVTEAIDALTKAEALCADGTPPARAVQLLLGELNSALGRTEEANTAYKRAGELSVTAEETLEPDRKRFELLRPAKNAPPPGAAFTLPDPLAGVQQKPGAALNGVAQELEQTARATPSVAAWLRAARWHSWMGSVAGARTDAKEAIALDPRSIPALDFLAKLDAATAEPAVAQADLRALAEANPSGKLEYRRRAVQLLLQMGRVDAAITSLQSLSATEPGNIDLLSDTALALQRADRWQEALETWKSAFAAAGPARKQEMLDSLLRAFEHLDLHQPAAELLLAQIDAQADPKTAEDLFKRLLAECDKGGLLPWLQETWKSRLNRKPGDYFTAASYGKILAAQGDQAAAFDVLSDAALEAGDEVETLPDLVREAEAMHRYDTAIALQKQAIRKSGASRATAEANLAELQERNLDFAGAAATWSSLASRFPRDSHALMQAAAYSMRLEDTAAALPLFRKVVALDPEELHAQFAIAAISSGPESDAEAVRCLEHILSATAKEQPGTPPRLPGMLEEDSKRIRAATLGRMRRAIADATPGSALILRPFAALPKADATDGKLREAAIRELAAIVRRSGAPELRAQWIDRWKGAAEEQPSTAMLALFEADAGEALFSVIAQLVQQEPENESRRRALVWLALETHQFPLLAEWMRAPERTLADRELLMKMISEQLQAHGTLPVEETASLFPSKARSRLWDLALAFANRGQFNAAVWCGEKAQEVKARGSNLSAIALANWQLTLGDTVAPLSILQSIAAKPAASYDAPSFTAMQMAMLLLPADERPAFAATLRSGLNEETHPLASVLTDLLLESLGGEPEAYMPAVLSLDAMHPLAPPDPDEPGNEGGRRWSLLLSAGLHLQRWNLDSTAISLWEMALADPSLIRLQGNEARLLAREARIRLFALQFAHAETEEIPSYFQRLEGFTPDVAVAVVDALQSSDAIPAALAVAKHLWERTPANPDLLRLCLNLCRLAGDDETAEVALRSSLSGNVQILNGTLHRDLVLDLASRLEKKGRLDEAASISLASANASLRDARLLAAAALCLQRAGRAAEAKRTVDLAREADPSSPSALLAYSTIVEADGDLENAAAVLPKIETAEAASRYLLLLYKAGKTESLPGALAHTAPQYQVAAAVALARAMTAKGDVADARTMLRDVALHSTDAFAAMQIQSALLETCTPPGDAQMIARGLHELRTLAEGEPVRTALYYSFLYQYGAALGIEARAESELDLAWADGKGFLPAGAFLISRKIERREEGIDAILAQFLAREDLDEQWLQVAEAALKGAERHDLLAKVEAQRWNRMPLDAARFSAWIHELQKAGDTAGLRAALTRASARAPLDDALAATAARAWIQLGEYETARQLLDPVIGRDTALHDFRPWLDAAQLKLLANDLPGARRCLATAYRHPGARDYATLLDYLDQAGCTEQFDTEATALGITGERKAEAKEALVARDAR